MNLQEVADQMEAECGEIERREKRLVHLSVLAIALVIREKYPDAAYLAIDDAEDGVGQDPVAVLDADLRECVDFGDEDFGGALYAWGGNLTDRHRTRVWSRYTVRPNERLLLLDLDRAVNDNPVGRTVRGEVA